MEKKKMALIPHEIITITTALKKAGFESYLVGGCVRDLLLNRIPQDWDVATNARPERVLEIFEHSHYDNEFGTVRVVNDDAEAEELKVVEITTYREEAQYSDSRRPDNVSFSDKLDDDLKRRDFTINALALSPSDLYGKEPNNVSLETHQDIIREKVVDLFGGIKDLDANIIRTVGDPKERFDEDALRMLRAIRIAVELSFEIDENTKSAIQEYSSKLENIATERIRDEFIRIIRSADPKRGLELSYETGLLRVMLPELEETIGVEQNQAHTYNLWEHLLRSLQATADKNWDLEIRIAALLHDTGKAPTRRWSDEKKDWTFYGHEVVGARLTRNILTRLKFPSKTIERVTTLVRWHMFFSDPEQITLSAVRRLLRNVGKENIWDLVNVRIADRIGTGRPKEEPYRLRKYQSMIEEALRDPISVGQLQIDGNRIMEITREKPGPAIGYILHALLDEVLDDPTKNSTTYLEKKALELKELPEEELKKLGVSGKETLKKEEKKEVGEIRKKYWVE